VLDSAFRDARLEYVPWGMSFGRKVHHVRPLAVPSVAAVGIKSRREHHVVVAGVIPRFRGGAHAPRRAQIHRVRVRMSEAAVGCVSGLHTRTHGCATETNW
jgi:hypothetical protein